MLGQLSKWSLIYSHFQFPQCKSVWALACFKLWTWSWEETLLTVSSQLWSHQPMPSHLTKDRWPPGRRHERNPTSHHPCLRTRLSVVGRVGAIILLSQASWMLAFACFDPEPLALIRRNKFPGLLIEQTAINFLTHPGFLALRYSELREELDTLPPVGATLCPTGLLFSRCDLTRHPARFSQRTSLDYPS